ncbi:MAG: electron transport complex subunit RsxG [Gammaproteobacteria bacterium]|nr:electron transport complex subunit RsxG [Gammaproteobacteria bacterium]MCW8988079.1 electron transport complex subunit RsxG [Gammaproteobacteria bacterium]MCW9031403.1 electron transport complex subunit RsxG [Gammaproteobacteria bacterium]
MNIIKNMIISAVVLALFAITGTFFVSYTYDNTIDRINENKRLALLKAFHVLIPPDAHDNDIFTDIIQVTNKNLLGDKKPVSIYRARKDNRPVAVIINSIAPDGYSGNIELLVAINYDGVLEGVRVVQHKETPGLGDAIDETRSDWITKFKQRSLTNPEKKGWAVKRDGGEFDQFTGATITPRAIVKAVYNTLRYYKEHRDTLYE